MKAFQFNRPPLVQLASRSSVRAGRVTVSAPPATPGRPGHLTDFNKWVTFIHTKILLVDPLTDQPTVISASANFSDSSTVDNEENSLMIRADAADGTGATIVRRVADIYITEYHRLFMHFVFRDRAERMGSDPAAARLVEEDSWSAPYYEPGGWRARQRQTFANTLPCQPARGSDPAGGAARPGRSRRGGYQWRGA